MKFYSIGHITEDLRPYKHISGSVAYASMVAKLFGYSATIITKCQPGHPYIKQLEAKGINVVNLPLVKSPLQTGLTTFDNMFDSQGCRKQIVSNIQEKITNLDLPFFPDIKPDDVIVVGSVIGEVSIELLNYLSKNNKLTLICQGYYREVNKSNYIIRKQWDNLALLNKTSIISVSNEDLFFNGKTDNVALNELIKKANITLYTLGEKGSEIYTNIGQKIDIYPFRLDTREIIELSGCGDVYTVVFILTYNIYKNLKLSGVFASLIASLKIRADLNRNNFGLNSCINKRSIIDFIDNNPERYKLFLIKNGIKNENIFTDFSRNFLTDRI